MMTHCSGELYDTKMQIKSRFSYHTLLKLPISHFGRNAPLFSKNQHQNKVLQVAQITNRACALRRCTTIPHMNESVRKWLFYPYYQFFTFFPALNGCTCSTLFSISLSIIGKRPSLWIGLFKIYPPQETSTIRTRPSFPGKVSTMRPIFHWLGGALSSETMIT